MTDEWAIMDSVGIIRTGTEEDVKSLWNDSDKVYLENMEIPVKGDLLLIEIHGRKK